jgi:hypothetical protein
MKYFFIAFFLIPSFSFASTYSCSGEGFSIELTDGPVEMKVKGSGVNAMAQDISISSTFNTVVTGNIINPAVTVKLTINDSGLRNPRDQFKADLQLSSASGIKEYSGIICTK